MLGTFDPIVDKHGLIVDVAKVEEWIKKGAKPTNTIARLLKGQGVKGMEPFVVEMKDRAVKNPKEEKAAVEPVADAPATKEKPAEEAAPVEAPAEEKKVEEAPVEEKKEEASVEDETKEDEKEEKPEEK